LFSTGQNFTGFTIKPRDKAVRPLSWPFFFFSLLYLESKEGVVENHHRIQDQELKNKNKKKIKRTVYFNLLSISFLSYIFFLLVNNDKLKVFFYRYKVLHS